MIEVTGAIVSSLLTPDMVGSALRIFARAGASIRAEFEKSSAGVRARRSRLIWRAIAGAVFAVGSVVALLGWLVFRWSIGASVASIGSALILGITLFVFGGAVYSSALAAFTPQAAIDAENARKEEQDRLNRDTTLPALLRYNREQMALYHEIATTQARAAGRNSQLAMAIGFIALVAGSVVAVVSHDVSTKLVTGSLAALGGVFSGYIARTFFVAQDKAIGQLYKYWEQPLTTSYVLTAERIASAFAESRTRERELGKLIDQLLIVAMRHEALPVGMSAEGGSTRRRTNRSTKDRGGTESQPLGSSAIDE